MSRLLAIAVVFGALAVPDKEFHAKSFKGSMILSNMLKRAGHR